MRPDTAQSGNSDPAARGRVTVILDDLRNGSPDAREDLFRLVYAELRHLAASALRRTRRTAATLQPTALVHEAYLRLMGGPAATWQDRAHFYGTAARAMRLILVDLARARSAAKRGGGRVRVTFDENRHGGSDPLEDVLAVHEALDRLRGIDEQKARIVELRFFAGLTIDETARALDITERTVYRQWDRARAWLFREISK